MTKKAFAIQYKPRENHPKANENDKKNTFFKLLALQIPNIANEKQNIRGYTLNGSSEKVAKPPSKKKIGVLINNM